MNGYICIAATFLADRFHGREWPPSPARLFQALLAGARTGLYRKRWVSIEPVLRELERLPSPEVVAIDIRKLPPYLISVPNNDSDKAAREWSAGRPFDAAALRTLKPICPQEMLTHSGGPHVYYLWKRGNGDLPFAALRELTSFLHTFGWGIDMAYADSLLLDEHGKELLAAKPGYSHYVPGQRGRLYDVPAPGYLQDLAGAYERSCKRSTEGVDPATRATKYGQERYQRVGGFELPVAKFVLRKLDNANTPYAVPWALGMKVAAWMRHAAAEALRQERHPKYSSEDFINSYVLGHGSGRSKHMSFVPVPNVGTIYPDGAIRRVMVVEPADGDGEIAALLQWKLATSVLYRLVENGGGPRKTQPVCQLFEAEEDKIWPYYIHSSLLWHSVTPVILHGYNSEHKIFSLKKTERLLYQAFEESGHSRQSIVELFFQPAPLWAGTEGALTLRVPEHLANWPRYHVAVRFREPVGGPVLVGIGRHYGIGLFAAPRDQNR